MGEAEGMNVRKAAVERKTNETSVCLELKLDGTGEYEIDTTLPFFNHMLESLAKQGLFDLRIEARGGRAG